MPAPRTTAEIIAFYISDNGHPHWRYMCVHRMKALLLEWLKDNSIEADLREQAEDVLMHLFQFISDGRDNTYYYAKHPETEPVTSVGSGTKAV